MVSETVDIIKRAVDQGMTIYVIVNNRAGGNGPLIAKEIAEKFVGRMNQEFPSKRTFGALNSWILPTS